ncbi:hypothetical protein V8F20_001453 [Naviculisporaceae sp. PSN 640]
MAVPEPFLGSVATITTSELRDRFAKQPSCPNEMQVLDQTIDRDACGRKEMEYEIQGIGDWVGEYTYKLQAEGREKGVEGKEKRREKRPEKGLGKEKMILEADCPRNNISSHAEIELYGRFDMGGKGSNPEITYGTNANHSTRPYEDNLGLQMAYMTKPRPPRQQTPGTSSILEPWTPYASPSQRNQGVSHDILYLSSALSLASDSVSNSASSEWISPLVRDHETGVLFCLPPTHATSSKEQYSQVGCDFDTAVT